MHLKVNRKAFTKKLSNFVTKGKLNYASGSSDEQVKNCNIYPEENGAKFIGSQEFSDEITALFYIEGEVEGDKIFVPNLPLLLNEIKDLKGEIIEITIGDEITVQDDHGSSTFGAKAGQKDLKGIESIYKNYDWMDEDIVLTVGDQSVTYNKWFSVEDGKIFGEIESKNNGTHGIESELITLQTQGEDVSVFLSNRTSRREWERSWEADVHENYGVNIKNVDSIFANLKGKVDFYYYVTKASGKLNVWIKTNTNDWLFQYKED